MDVLHNQIFFPVSFSELFSVWNRCPDAVLLAGGTELIARQGQTILELPDVILCLEKISELQNITRTEHYLEIGSMVSLNKIIRLGKTVPQALCDCLENISGVQLRNTATIGGNICCASRLLDAPAALIALDAQYEFRSASSSRWVASSHFHSEEELFVSSTPKVLTRIRLPLHHWDYSIYKKFYSEDLSSNRSLTFLAKAQKNILSDIKVVYKGQTILRNKNGESVLIGKHLPLNRKAAADFVENWREFLADNIEMDEFLKNELLNHIEINVYNLAE